jgi:tetratricopeptide (TPR) repeat protein
VSGNCRIILLTFILLISSIGCAKQNQTLLKNNTNHQEDLYIMLALDSEKNLDFINSYEYYLKLYKLTHKKDYLQKSIVYSLKMNKYQQTADLAQEAIKRFPENKVAFMQQYIVALTLQGKYDQALLGAKDLLKEFPTADSYEMVANVYYSMKEYQQAIQYYESAYAKNKNEDTLAKLTDILYNYLKQKDAALAYLETYIQTHECNPKICNKLMLIYQEQGNIDGMLSILTRMYNKYKHEEQLSKTTLFIQKLIISLLERKDLKQAIKFLEETKIDQTKLINLYYQDRQLEKALRLTKKLYKQTKNPELLGKIAMYRFELADDKREALKHVLANFELALSSGINNAAFQNYYGYLLIDYNIDIVKGIDLVKQALETAPNNIAYLDSLAWGYYKIDKCKEAYRVMEQVVSMASTNDPEIKMHWSRIKDCKKKTKDIKQQ